MKFNKNAWHVKFNRNFGFDLESEARTYDWDSNTLSYNGVSLCKYFWVTMFNVVAKAAPLAFIVGGLALLVLNGFYVLVAGLLALVIDITAYQGSHEAAIAFWIIYAVVSATVIVMMFLDRSCRNDFGVWPKYFPLDKWLSSLAKRLPKYENKSKPYVEKEPSLLVEYIKAKKQKFCPYVSIKEQNNE